jgi:hypothetical protein
LLFLCAQSNVLCGWLLPGPVSGWLSGAPRLCAICAAVLPFPYRFDTSGFAPTVVCDGLLPLCAVCDEGLTPAELELDDAFFAWPGAVSFFAWPGAVFAWPGALDCAAGCAAVWSCFCCPGAFAEFPPPASADPVKDAAAAASAKAQTARAYVRLIFSTSFVRLEGCTALERASREPGYGF